MAASIRDVALAAGVSVGTVSNVLNRPEKVAPATVARVMSAIDELGFVRNDAARQLRAGRSRSFGLVVLDSRNPFFMDVAHGAQSRAFDDGYTVLLGGSDDSPARERSLLEMFEEHRVAGVLITPVDADLTPLWRLREAGTPVVLVDRGSSDRSFTSVSVDDIEGGRIAARHLLECGRRRIAFVGGPLGITQVTERLDGARSVVAAQPGASLEVFETQALSVLEGRRIGERIAALPPAERPDAVFAANDLLAMGVLQALVMMGSIRVPEDIALIGYDDIDFTSAAVVPISSVRQPAIEIGRTAVELLLREAAAAGGAGRAGRGRGAGPAEREQVMFTPELVVRASTRPS